jgi:uncharacterized membrane protein
MAGVATAHFRTGWRAFRAQPGVFVASLLILFASWAALEVSVIALHRFGVVLDVLLHLAFLVVFSGLAAGLVAIALEVLSERKGSLETLFSLLARGPRVLLGACLYLLGTVAGLILLVVPGIYLAVRWALFGMVLATRDATAVESLRAAGSLSEGRWPAMCGFLARVLLLNLAGAAVLGVGLLVTVPVTLLATGSLFRTLEAARNPGSGK